MLTAQVRPWPTPTVNGNNNVQGLSPTSGDGLGTAVRPCATPDANAHKGSTREGQRRGQITEQVTLGRRLSSAWVETLMGLPLGWTEVVGPRQHAEPDPCWPRGRYPKGWDRSVLWPGYGWEPARTLPDGPPRRGRPARLRLLGNAVVPQQGALAIETWAGEGT